MSEKTGATPIVADKGHPMNWALPDGAISRFGHGSVMAMAVSPDGAYLPLFLKYPMTRKPFLCSLQRKFTRQHLRMMKTVLK